jgi:hypothetical protein
MANATRLKPLTLTACCCSGPGGYYGDGDAAAAEAVTWSASMWPPARIGLDTTSSSNAREHAMDAEFADVTDHDVTTITCVCGNTVGDDGLIQANSEGIPVHAGGSTPAPAGLADWPADEDLYTLCPSCGRVYRDTVIEETGTAPVAFRVDVATGSVAEAIRVHWDHST